jgi:hypothetical protein
MELEISLMCSQETATEARTELGVCILNSHTLFVGLECQVSDKMIELEIFLLVGLRAPRLLTKLVGKWKK